MRTPGRMRGVVMALSALTLSACEPAEDVRVMPLPPLEQTSVERRLGLPLMQGSWPFAGWELAEGDTLGMEEELPVFGTIVVMEQKRDSLGGAYQGAGGGSTPLSGEVRRDGVVALVAFPNAQDGRYLVGSVDGDTLWVESTTLIPAGGWRSASRAAFVRGDGAAAPFRRIRGAVSATLAPAAADTLVEMSDTLPLTAEVPAGEAVPSPAPAPPAGPVQPDVPDEPVTNEPDSEPEPPPSTTPTVPRREPPRILGVPVERDSP